MPLRNLVLLPKSHEEGYSSLLNVQDRLNALFDTFFSEVQVAPRLGLPNRFPSISVSEAEKAIVVQAELPAMSEQDVKIDVHKNRVIISGEKKNELNEDQNNYHICELSYGKFSRSVSLPFDIDSSKVKASFSKGVLTITVPKPASETTHTQTVPITAEG